MFSVYTVCFFGHRLIDDFRLVEDAVESVIADVVNKHEFVEFLVGREGDFDQIVSSLLGIHIYTYQERAVPQNYQIMKWQTFEAGPVDY